MFSMDCQSLNGTSIGVCGDSFSYTLYGSCCDVPPALKPDADDQEDLNALSRIGLIQRFTSSASRLHQRKFTAQKKKSSQ